MKKILTVVVLLIMLMPGKAQVIVDDFGKVALNTYLPDNLGISSDAKKQLQAKLTQLVTQNGIAGSEVNPRFIITAAVTIGTKDIIPGPPQMIAQNLSITMFIGDAVDNKVFSSVEIAVKGVGRNENKSFIEAIKNINPKRKDLIEFVDQGNSKIVSYYNSQCEQMLSDALNLAQRERYDEAMDNLSLVPSACTSCYVRCTDRMYELYQARLNQDGKNKLSEANAVWAATRNLAGAEKAVNLLSQIHIDANCKIDAEILITQISAKLQADEKRDWQFKLKQYEDAQKMERERIKMMEESDVRNSQLQSERLHAAKQVALEYAKNQPKTITYNNIYWR